MAKLFLLSLGSNILPDFFFDEAMDHAHKMVKDSSSSVPDSNTPSGVFQSIKPLLSEEVVKSVGASYLFILSGENQGNCILDLKTGGGSVGEVSGDTQTDVTFMMDSISIWLKCFKVK